MHPSALTGQQADSQHSEEKILMEPHFALNQFVALGAAQSSINVLKNLLNRLAGFFQLSEEEKNEAGIYLGNQHYK